MDQAQTSYKTAAMRSTPAHDRLAEVRFRLMQAGCEYSFRHRAWRCPSCRTVRVLRIHLGIDESVVANCARGCPRGAILGAVGLTFMAVGPSMFAEWGDA